MHNPAISSLVDENLFKPKKRKIKLSKNTKILLSVLTGFVFVFAGSWIYSTQNASAASSPWTQTDWSGGTASGTVSDTVTTYSSVSNLDTSTSGQFSLEGPSIATLKGNQLSDSSTNFNVATKTALRYNTSQDYNDSVFSYSGGSPTRLTVDADGDYFFSLTIPITSNASSTGNRNAIEAEVRVNGTKVDIGVGRSTYIRNSSQEESSAHLSGLLQGLSAGDYVEVFVARTTTQTTNTLTGNFTFYAEQIPSSEAIFWATGTRTDAGTNLNGAESAMQWSEVVEDSGYTHAADSSTITLDDADNYFVAVNIPLGGSVSRGNITGRVELDGSLVDGGIFQQGYIRNADAHTDSSLHWSGVVTTSSASQDLQITVQQESSGGTITTDSEKATIYIQKMPASDLGVYHGEATTVNGGSNWNPAAAAIDWATDNIIDTDTYTKADTQTISVDEAGDYLLSFNWAGTSSGTRVNPIGVVQVNGSDVTGAKTKTGYMRQSNHNNASGNLLIPLIGLSADDDITINMDREGATTTTDDSTPGVLMLWKKSYAASGSLVSNIFDAGFSADWGTLTYNSSGTGTVTVKVRSDSNSDMSGATDWSSCTGISSSSDISSNGCVTDGHRYLQYQVTLEPASGQTPVFEDISIAFTSSDSTAPTTNASSVAITDLGDTDTWTNTEPTITWAAGADDGGGEGLLGYCVSLDEGDIGVSSSLDPELSGGALGALDDGVDETYCPFIVTGTSLDLSTVSGLTLTTNKQYYFSIKAVDIPGNVYTGASNTYQDLVDFKYDNTAPTGVTFISTPSTVFGNIDDMFWTWPISGGSAASDAASGLAGWQYSINSTSAWTGPDTHAGTGNAYIADDTSTSQHNLNDAIDTAVVVGNNTVYFRAMDNAGNFSTYVTGGLSYGGAAPTWAAESVVTISPSTSTSNAFTVSWPAADANNGGSITSYYYMINTTPPSSLSTLEGNSSIYRPTTSTNPITSGTITGAVRGSNTIYVVAVDDEDNYSPSNYISGTFTLNSTNPDPPTNLLGTDASIKSEEIWRATLTWGEPSYKGTGELSYKIQRSTDNSSWTTIDTISSRSYTDTVDTSTTWYYRVGTMDTSNASINDPSYAASVEILTKGTFDEPPDLSAEPVVTGITTKRATISWSTSRTSDSKIQYGTGSGDYFDEEPSNSAQVTDHQIALDNLDPGTKYYFVAKWTDEDGNTGTSDELSFETEPAPTVSEVSAINIGITQVTIQFTEKNASTATIYYGETSSFGGLTEISTSKSETTYTVNITGLSDGTKYFYKINTFDEEGEEYEGTTLTFETLPRPRISNVRIQQVRGTAQPTALITWDTNTDVSSIVTYYPDGNPSAARDEVNVALKSGEHRMIVRALLPQTRYILQVSGRDVAGNEAVSDTQTFTTATDTRPPLIQGLRIEGSIIPSQSGGETQAQLTVSWDTDEGATSQVEYGEGTGSNYSQRTQEDSNLTFNHLVVISGLTPSRVYHLRAISADEAGNVTQSIDTVTIAPKATDSALDLVISNLQEAFGFLGGI